jgi:hypothetical protein
MNPYVSPALYRTMGFGVDLTDLEDSDLNRQLLVASMMINRHCNQPTRHDFRGGTITDEKHRWEVSNGYAPGTQRIWVDHQPLLAVSQFRIQVTGTQYLEVSTDRLHLTDKYIEPVIAASSIGVWSYSAVPVAGYVIPEARVNYTYGRVIEEVGEVLFPDGGLVFRAANEWWTEDDVAVYLNGTLLTETTDYTLDRDAGLVTLVAEFDLDDVVTADYSHKLPWEIRDATGLVATQLLGNRAIVAAGMQGISGIKIEEVEIRQSRDAQAAKTEISGLAAELLEPYRWRGFA